jgi:hypothetical protein
MAGILTTCIMQRLNGMRDLSYLLSVLWLRPLGRASNKPVKFFSIRKWATHLLPVTKYFVLVSRITRAFQNARIPR